jgi:hypothetical protein
MNITSPHHSTTTDRINPTGFLTPTKVWPCPRVSLKRIRMRPAAPWKHKTVATTFFRDIEAGNVILQSGFIF